MHVLVGGPGEKTFGSDSRKFAKLGTDVVHTVLNHFKMGAKIFLHFKKIYIFNMGISIDISVYPCKNYFSKSEKPIFTKCLV